MTTSEFAFQVIMCRKRIKVEFIEPSSRHFRFNGTSYTPDFFDPLNNIYYEVSGTRQAYHANKNKIVAFRKAYPKVNLLVVKPDGTSIN